MLDGNGEKLREREKRMTGLMQNTIYKCTKERHKRQRKGKIKEVERERMLVLIVWSRFTTDRFGKNTLFVFDREFCAVLM